MSMSNTVQIAMLHPTQYTSPNNFYEQVNNFKIRLAQANVPGAVVEIVVETVAFDELLTLERFGL